jgi:hypothetical protein
MAMGDAFFKAGDVVALGKASNGSMTEGASLHAGFV